MTGVLTDGYDGGMAIEAASARVTYSDGAHQPIRPRTTQAGFDDEDQNGMSEIGVQQDRGEVFIQWKGTDVCLDFYCICGKQGHIDADFVYAIECPNCGRIWEMPNTIELKLRPAAQ